MNGLIEPENADFVGVRIEKGKFRDNIIIIFKSNIDYFYKEKAGLKRNTVRKIDDDERFKILENSKDILYKTALYVEIILYHDLLGVSDKFEKLITDISYFDNFVIISWNE